MTLLEGRLVYDQLIMFHPDAGTGPEGDGPSTLCPPAACLMVPATASARRRRRRQCQRHRVSVPGTDQYNTRSPVLASTVNCRVQRSPSRCEVNGVAEEHGRQWHLPHGIASSSVFVREIWDLVCAGGGCLRL